MITQQNCPPSLSLLEALQVVSQASGTGSSQSTSLVNEPTSIPLRTEQQIGKIKRIKANFIGRDDGLFDEIVISPAGLPMCNFTFTLLSRFHRRQPQCRFIWVKQKCSFKTPLKTKRRNLFVLRISLSFQEFQLEFYPLIRLKFYFLLASKEAEHDTT